MVEAAAPLPPLVKWDGERKTSAADGAGTKIEHVPGGEHVMVFMFCVPCKRPSEAKLSPNV